MMASNLSARALGERIDRLSPRERLILLLTTLVVAWGLADSLLLGPLAEERKLLTGRLAELRARAEAADAALAGLAARPDAGSDARARRATLRATLENRLVANDTLRARLVDAKAMPRVLEGLLARHPGLRLAALKTLAPEPVGRDDDRPGEQTAFFRHGVELILEGDYAALTRYLQALERAPLGVLWGRAGLDASNHPRLRLTLTVYTLSENSTWLKL